MHIVTESRLAVERLMVGVLAVYCLKSPVTTKGRPRPVRGSDQHIRIVLQLDISCRCPADGGLLGAACRLPDGLWVWIAGARLSPSASWDEFRSEYIDVLDEGD